MTLIPTIQTQQSPAAMTMRGRNIVSKEQRREGELLVSIMPIGSKDKYYNLGVVDFVNDPVLLGDTAAPLAGAVSGERLGLTCACTRMFPQFGNQSLRLGEGLWLIPCQKEKMLVGHRRVDNIICHSHAFSDKLSNPHLATSYVLHLGHTGLSPRPRGGKTPPSSSAWGLPSWLPASLNTWLTASSAARCRRLQPYRAKSVHSTVLLS